jgi:NAD-dependent deacetylase
VRPSSLFTTGCWRCYARRAVIDDDVRATLEGAVRGDGPIVALTGAGISAESGIPTFRGKEGYWTVGSREYHPQEMATGRAFQRMPREVWRWYLYRRSVCRAAVPNAGHVALADADRALGDRFVLVTQNVDGLHLRAGSPTSRTLQIHGNIDYMRCASECCTALHVVPATIPAKSREDELGDDELAQLRCPKCGAAARPHVLWFDESYDEELFRAETALRVAARAELLVVVGTAGATNLPQQIAAIVARAGRPIIDVNVDDNPFAAAARRTGGHALRGGAAQLLPALVQHMVATSGGPC